MANSHYEKKWKYVSIGLMAVLAVGFSFPQAFAHITSNVPHGFQHILDALAPLQSDVDNIQTGVNDIKTQTNKIMVIKELNDSSGEVTTSSPFVFRFSCDDTFVLNSIYFSGSSDNASDQWNPIEIKHAGGNLNIYGLDLSSTGGSAPFGRIPLNVGIDNYSTAGVVQIIMSKSADGEEPDFAAASAVFTVASDATCELI